MLDEKWISFGIELKLLEKRLESSANRAEKDSMKKHKLLVDALKKGNEEAARIHAESILRIKKDVKTSRILAAKVSGMRLRLQQMQATQQVAKVMASLTKQLQFDQDGMFSLEHVAAIMDKFETSSENMDVVASVLDKSMSNVSQSNEVTQDVDALINEIAEQNSLQLATLLPQVAASQRIQSKQKDQIPAASSSKLPDRSLESIM